MRIVGVLVVLAGWLIPVVGVAITQSTPVRFALALLGIAVTFFGIAGVLNKAHLKSAIWKA
jgi:hypothetical protein